MKYFDTVNAKICKGDRMVGRGAEKKEQGTSHVFYINVGNTYWAASRSGFMSPLKCFLLSTRESLHHIS